MASRSGAPTFPRARARRALQKTIARTFECPSFPRAFSPISIQNVVPSQRVCLSLFNREVSRSSRFRVHATSRAISARARRRRNAGFSRNGSRFFVCFFFVGVASFVLFSFTSRAPFVTDAKHQSDEAGKKRDDQRHRRHGSNELLFFLSFLLGPRASLAHSRSFFHISILGFQRISFFFIFITTRVFLLP